MPIAYVSRTESFSSAHRLHSSLLSHSENQQLYGKCNNPNGHGHNYTDPQTGMVVNISDLKKCIQENVLQVVDHKHLDLDVPYFKDNVSTTENLAVFIWKQLQPTLGLTLYEIELYETPKNKVIFRGDGIQ